MSTQLLPGCIFLCTMNSSKTAFYQKRQSFFSVACPLYIVRLAWVVFVNFFNTSNHIFWVTELAGCSQLVCCAISFVVDSLHAIPVDHPPISNDGVSHNPFIRNNRRPWTTLQGPHVNSYQVEDDLDNKPQDLRSTIVHALPTITYLLSVPQHLQSTILSASFRLWMTLVNHRMLYIVVKPNRVCAVPLTSLYAWLKGSGEAQLCVHYQSRIYGLSPTVVCPHHAPSPWSPYVHVTPPPSFHVALHSLVTHRL